MLFADVRQAVRDAYQFVQGISPAALDRLIVEPFTYPVIFENVAPGNSPTAILNIAANADFFLLQPLYRAVVDDDTPDADAMCTVFMADTGSNIPLMQQPMDIAQFFGKKQRADSSIAFPRLIQRNAGMSIQLTNYSEGVTYSRVELDFVGVRVYSYGAV